jgi:hypothetical protein
MAEPVGLGLRNINCKKADPGQELAGE